LPSGSVIAGTLVVAFGVGAYLVSSTGRRRR
jgi:hypothetical protein